jgi:hypothetical protein
MDEIGSGAMLEEDASRFRQHAAERIGQMCQIAAEHHLRYRGWWIEAPGFSDYVTQVGGSTNVVSEVPPK